MVSLLLSLLMLFQVATPFEIRAKDNLIFGKGEKSGTTYYDVVITQQPNAGVLLRLPYTRKGGKFTFDLHHRLPLNSDFTTAEVTTIVQVLTGATTSIGTYTMSDRVTAADKTAESIVRTSTSEVDKAITPVGTKTIVLDIRPGPQSISIVGQTQIITRGTTTSRIDTPGARIATISNLKFEEVTEINPLKRTPPQN
jgi:hypothetical protein